MSKKLNPLQAEYNRELGYLKSTITQGTKYGWHYPDIELPTIEGIPTKEQIEQVRQIRQNIYKDESTFKVVAATWEVKTKSEIQKDRRKGIKDVFIDPSTKGSTSPPFEIVSSTPEPTGAPPQEYEYEDWDKVNDELYPPQYDEADLQELKEEQEALKEADQIIENLYDMVEDIDPRYTGGGLWRPNRVGYHAQDTMATHRAIILDILENSKYGLAMGITDYARYIKGIAKELDEAFRAFDNARYDGEITTASSRLANLLSRGNVSQETNMKLSENESMESVDYEDEVDY